VFYLKVSHECDKQSSLNDASIVGEKQRIREELLEKSSPVPGESAEERHMHIPHPECKIESKCNSGPSRLKPRISPKH